MKPEARLTVVKLLPVILVSTAAMAYVVSVEWPGPYALLNTLPMLAVTGLAAFTLRRGGGRWTGAGWRWLLGTFGFALPAMGVTIYLHYGYAIDRGGMASEALHPETLFRYLPLYALFAGGIGFAIGWIAGRNI